MWVHVRDAYVSSAGTGLKLPPGVASGGAPPHARFVTALDETRWRRRLRNARRPLPYRPPLEEVSKAKLTFNDSGHNNKPTSVVQVQRTTTSAAAGATTFVQQKRERDRELGSSPSCSNLHPSSLPASGWAVPCPCVGSALVSFVVSVLRGQYKLGGHRVYLSVRVAG